MTRNSPTPKTIRRIPHSRNYTEENFPLQKLYWRELPTPETIRRMSSNFKQRFMRSFGWKIVSSDWLMVALNTIGQSQLTLVHPSDPRNHCAENLTSFPLYKVLEWGIEPRASPAFFSLKWEKPWERGFFELSMAWEGSHVLPNLIMSNATSLMWLGTYQHRCLRLLQMLARDRPWHLQNNVTF